MKAHQVPCAIWPCLRYPLPTSIERGISWSLKSFLVWGSKLFWRTSELVLSQASCCLWDVIRILADSEMVISGGDTWTEGSCLTGHGPELLILLPLGTHWQMCAFVVHVQAFGPVQWFAFGLREGWQSTDVTCISIKVGSTESESPKWGLACVWCNTGFWSLSMPRSFGC